MSPPLDQAKESACQNPSTSGSKGNASLSTSKQQAHQACRKDDRAVRDTHAKVMKNCMPVALLVGWNLHSSDQLQRSHFQTATQVCQCTANSSIPQCCYGVLGQHRRQNCCCTLYILLTGRVCNECCQPALDIVALAAGRPVWLYVRRSRYIDAETESATDLSDVQIAV